MMSVYFCAVRLKDADSHCTILYWIGEIVATPGCLWDVPKSLSISASNVTWHVPAIVSIAVRHPCVTGFQLYTIVQDSY